MKSNIRLRALLGLCLSALACSAQSGAPPTPVPLTGEQRWDRYWHQSFLSPGLYAASAGAAIGGQLSNDPPEWGQGTKGYSHRVGSLFATFALQTTLYEGSSAVLGYEPRYLRCQCRGFRPRFAYAVKRTFVTTDNMGRLRPQFPSVIAAYGSGMLSTYWYPDRYNPLKDGFRQGNQQMGFQVGVNVIQEFGPELKRIFRRKK